MSDRDNELDELLKPLKESNPSPLQTQQWNSAVRSDLSRTPTPTSTPSHRRPNKVLQVAQLVAAVFVGFLIGAWVFHSQVPTLPGLAIVAENSSSNATFEYSRANLD